MTDNVVLVTGIGGFAGGHLSPCLTENKYRVVGTSNLHNDVGVLGRNDVCFVDLRQPDQIATLVKDIKPTHVVHLAAISFVGHGNVSEIYETNIVGTRNLLTALRNLEEKPRAVLLTSSANVYGNSEKGVLDETDDVNPANDYAVSKIAMEYMARQFADELNLIIARPFNYTGPGQSPSFLVPKIVNHFREKAPFIELGNTDVSRDFSDVRDVVAVLRALLETPAAVGEVVNICSGRPCSLREVIETCSRLTGHDIEIRVNPAFVRTNEVKSLVGNPQKLRDLTGLGTTYSMEDTLRWMLEA